MRITKLVHSCLLVETPGRTVVFDPASFSTLDINVLERLDDIFITHNHGDHMGVDLIAKLVAKFPDVRILAPAQAVQDLAEAGIAAVGRPPEGVVLFDSPHEPVEPLFLPSEEYGIHYLRTLSHPGDSLSFHETMPVLALPVQAPWGDAVAATRLALELKPRYVIPIHDWHWSEPARTSMYNLFDEVFKRQGIVFIKAVNGQSFTIDL